MNFSALIGALGFYNFRRLVSFFSSRDPRQRRINTLTRKLQDDAMRSISVLRDVSLAV